MLEYIPKKILRILCGMILLASCISYRWFTYEIDLHGKTTLTQGVYSISYFSASMTGKSEGTIEVFHDGEGNQVATLHGTGHLGDDRFEFGPYTFQTETSDLYFYYGPTAYKSLSQIGLSQAIHQYFWLGDSYEEKRYYASGADISLESRSLIETAEKYGFDLHHTQTRNPLWLEGHSTFGKSIGTGEQVQTLTGSITYQSKPKKESHHETPSQHVDADIFIQAFWGSGLIVE